MVCCIAFAAALLRKRAEQNEVNPAGLCKALITPRVGDDALMQCLERCRAEVCAALGLQPSQLELSMGMSGDFEQAVSTVFPAASMLLLCILAQDHALQGILAQQVHVQAECCGV